MVRGKQDCEKCGAPTFRSFDILHCTNHDCLHAQYNDGWEEELKQEAAAHQAKPSEVEEER